MSKSPDESSPPSIITSEINRMINVCKRRRWPINGKIAFTFFVIAIFVFYDGVPVLVRELGVAFATFTVLSLCTAFVNNESTIRCLRDLASRVEKARNHDTER
jgi:hypothetical protein